jgi:hypothetical protein
MNPELENTILQLKSKNKFPKKMELVRFGEYVFSNLYDDRSSSIISESVATGFDHDPEKAIWKSLSEFYEGFAFQEGKKLNLKSCLTERSDGLAAFPKIKAETYFDNARENARLEATERFVWANWWDNTENGHEVQPIDELKLNSQLSKLTIELNKICNIERINAVFPHYEKNHPNEQVVILIGYLKNGGVVSGGACGINFDETILRSLSELLRHGLAINKIYKSESSLSFYENRLRFFSTSEGEKIVSERLDHQGAEKIQLNNIVIDEEIPFSLDDIFYVHRFLYQDQPTFIGGKLERFCI